METKKAFYVNHIVLVVNTPDEWSRTTGKAYAKKVLERGPGFGSPPALTPPVQEPREPLAIVVGTLIAVGLIEWAILTFCQ